MYCIYNRCYGSVCICNEHFCQYLKINFWGLNTSHQGPQLYEIDIQIFKWLYGLIFC